MTKVIFVYGHAFRYVCKSRDNYQIQQMFYRLRTITVTVINFDYCLCLKKQMGVGESGSFELVINLVFLHS